MAAALAIGLSLDEFLDGHYERAELFGGEVRTKPAPTFVHGRMQLRLGRLLGDFFGESRVATEVSLRIGEESPVPDVVVCSADEPQLYRGIIAEPPLLCVEVVSPSQTSEEMFAKCLRYRRFGVPYCWVIDPDGRRAWEMIENGIFAQVEEALATPPETLRSPQRIRLTSLFGY